MRLHEIHFSNTKTRRMLEYYVASLGHKSPCLCLCWSDRPRLLHLPLSGLGLLCHVAPGRLVEGLLSGVGLKRRS